MGYGADSPGASEDSGLEDYDWDDVAAHLFSRGSLLSLVLIAFLATRFWLLSEFTASGTDAILYGGFARLGVDCGQIPYRDFEIEYPPVAWWLMAAPRVMASERYALPTLSHTTTWEFLANYFWWFHLELFIADTLCLGMMFLVGGQISRAAQGVLPAAYVALSAAQPNLIYDRLDIVLLLFSLLCAYCWRALAGSFAVYRPLGVRELPVSGPGDQLQDHAGAVGPFFATRRRACRQRRLEDDQPCFAAGSGCRRPFPDSDAHGRLVGPAPVSVPQ